MKVGTYPSPVSAQQPWICHRWDFSDVRFSSREISAAVILPFTSCLFARIRTDDLCRS